MQEAIGERVGGTRGACPPWAKAAQGRRGHTRAHTLHTPKQMHSTDAGRERTRSRGRCPMIPHSSILPGARKVAARLDKPSIRALAAVTVMSVLAAMVASMATARASTAAETASKGWNRLANGHFDPSTWRPTAEEPLPALASPITFKLGDEPSYWYDNGRPDLEGILHTRSLGVSEGPTTVRFSVGEPQTSVQHTFTSLIWPEGAQNMPFKQEGGLTGDHEVNLVTPG